MLFPVINTILHRLHIDLYLTRCNIAFTYVNFHKIFAIGQSIVASGAEAKVYGRNLPVTVRGISIEAVSS